MKKFCVLVFYVLPLFASAQMVQLSDTLKAPLSYENVFVKPLASDSLASSYVIFIKKEVKKHKHLFHTEHVYVLDGEGELLLGDKTLLIKKGDIVFIPKNTIHAFKVTSVTPVKIISIQAPYFDGKDRVLME